MHFESTYFDNVRVFEGMYLAVDFFFILSGYFIYQMYEKAIDKSVIKYVKKRLLEFWPPTIFMLLLYVLYNLFAMIKNGIGIINIMTGTVDTLLSSFFEVLFLQMFIPVKILNFPIWYISVLMVMGTLIYYYLYKLNGKIMRVIPLVLIFIIGVYGYLYIRYGNIDIHTAVNPVLGFYDGVLRGLADLLLGIIIFAIGKMISPKVILKISPLIIIRILLIIGIVWCMVARPHSAFDFVFILFATLLIILETTQAGRYPISTTQKRMLIYARKIIMYVYFCHYFICKLLWMHVHSYFVANRLAEWFLFFIVIVLAGMIIMHFIKFFIKRIL